MTTIKKLYARTSSFIHDVFTLGFELRSRRSLQVNPVSAVSLKVHSHILQVLPLKGLAPGCPWGQTCRIHWWLKRIFRPTHHPAFPPLGVFTLCAPEGLLADQQCGSARPLGVHYPLLV